jgi:hypothetical protein
MVCERTEGEAGLSSPSQMDVLLVRWLGFDSPDRLLRADYEESKYHMSWNYHMSMTSLVPDYSTTFHTTSHSDSYYYRD